MTQDVTGLVERCCREAVEKARAYWEAHDGKRLTAQAERIAELERDIKHAITMEQFAIDRANKLERDLAASREDAERYRCAVEDVAGQMEHEAARDGHPKKYADWVMSLRAAIDAARSK